jgi:hypothetical protein
VDRGLVAAMAGLAGLGLVLLLVAYTAVRNLWAELDLFGCVPEESTAERLNREFAESMPRVEIIKAHRAYPRRIP